MTPTTPLQNEPQLSAEMEKRLEDVLSSSVEMGVGPRKEKMLKEFIATALEEQKQSFIFDIETMELSGKSDDYKQAQDDIITLLTQKKEDTHAE